MKRTSFLAVIVLIFSLNIFAQLNLPRESQRQEIVQTVGDTKISIVYNRPNVKARKVWGSLVPYGEVWRTGANEATVFEVSNDVTIEGKPLPAGKYSLHTIPNKNEWTIIFNKTWNQWGSFNYDQKEDALRVTVKPLKDEFQETLSLNFENVTDNTAQVALNWEKLAVPFTVNVGDVRGRTLTQIREAVKNRKDDDIRPLNQGASYVLSTKLRENYEEALGWLDASLRVRETFGTLNTKARLLAEMGRKDEAISTAEKAIAVGKAANPPANTADLEKLLTQWKAKK